MPAATPEERAAMERAQAGLLQQLREAERYAASIQAGWFLSDPQRAALKAIADERKRFTTWSTAWRQWALEGREPVAMGGRAYSVAFWLRIGGDMASALRVYSQGLYQADLFTIIKGTAQQSVEDVKPGNWPPWLQLAAGVAVLAGVLVIASNLSRALRA